MSRMLAAEAWPIRVLRVLLGALALTAVGVDFVRSMGYPDFSPVNFFSYFTVLSNIAAGVLLITLAFAAADRQRSAEPVRGALTVYLALTGLVFAILLADGDLGRTLPWVNTVWHRVIPAALFVDWLAVRQHRKISYPIALTWVSIPVLYIVYSLVRGLAVGWYPYPFLQPDLVGGIGGVLVRLGIMAAGILVASMLVAWLGNARVAAQRPQGLDHVAASRFRGKS